MRGCKLRSVRERVRSLLGRWEILRPLLERAHLWHWSRRGVALGSAIGVFYGFLIPVGQIPASALTAALLRANVPMAVAGTWITNPLTTAPAYYGMYRLGAWILGQTTSENWGALGMLDHIGEVGRALLVGAPIAALVLGLISYLGVSLIWRYRVSRRRPDLLKRLRAVVKRRREAGQRSAAR